MSFSIGAVPYERICLMRALAARVLCDGAFEYSYGSFEQLLNKPDLENVDYIKLEWRRCWTSPSFQFSTAPFGVYGSGSSK